MTTRFYVAASYPQHAAAEALAFELRKRGAEVVSTWHEPDKVQPSEPGTKTGKAGPWLQCKAEVRAATDIVFLADLGSPRASYVEAGYALALAEESFGRGSVHWITREMAGAPIAAGDSNVRWWVSAAEFLERAKEL